MTKPWAVIIGYGETLAAKVISARSVEAARDMGIENLSPQELADGVRVSIFEIAPEPACVFEVKAELEGEDEDDEGGILSNKRKATVKSERIA